jgi:F-type H+-transporting ATPase subunit b
VDHILAAETHNPVVPIWQEVVVGTIAFALLVFVLGRFVWPRMEQTFQARVDAIEGGIARAEEAQAEAQRTLEQYRAQLADARNEANRLIEEARKSADVLRADLQQRAQADIAELRARAAADVEAAKSSALADLRAEVANLAIGAAETIVQKNLDHETQLQLVENYIRQVGSRS